MTAVTREYEICVQPGHGLAPRPYSGQRSVRRVSKTKVDSPQCFRVRCATWAGTLMRLLMRLDIIRTLIDIGLIFLPVLRGNTNYGCESSQYLGSAVDQSEQSELIFTILHKNCRNFLSLSVRYSVLQVVVPFSPAPLAHFNILIVFLNNLEFLSSGSPYHGTHSLLCWRSSPFPLDPRILPSGAVVLSLANSQLRHAHSILHVGQILALLKTFDPDTVVSFLDADLNALHSCLFPLLASHHSMRCDHSARVRFHIRYCACALAVKFSV